MVWRVPSREIGAVPYEEGLELPPEYITRDASELETAEEGATHIFITLIITVRF